jgi:DNA-binding MarR family transcriptional regulator/ribosomal protein S18 acetylase RimI-like enzyme
MEDQVGKIRQFNRTVTRRLGVLNARYLGRDRPLVESRLLFEIGTKGAPVRDLRERLGLDSGYVSRLLHGLERKGLAATRRQPGQDGRAKFARLTRSGKAELRRINALSDDLAKSMLTPLTGGQAARLVSAMSEVDRLLRASAIELTAVAPQDAGAQWCLGRYFDELGSRFPGGYDRGVDSATDLDDFSPPKGCFFVAGLFGEPVGCGGIRTFAPRIGEIKRLWVSPEVRGLGVGRRLLEALERAARQRKMGRIRLDTHESLTEAQNLYRNSGYREIVRFNDNPYAHHWFEKSFD